jgi:hypothetical protein
MSFDLNINNYAKSELEEMFGLSGYYDATSILQKELKLRDTIINNKQISKETQMRTLNFLVQAKQILLNIHPNTQAITQTKENDNMIEKLFHLNPNMTQTAIESKSEHMIQQRPTHPYLSTGIKEYTQGIINPLNKSVIIKNLNIDTRFRENYYTSPSTNFNITLPTNFSNVVTMQLSAIEVPNSFYSISKQYDNNYFTININNEEAAVVRIGSGTYSNVGIATAINNALYNLGGNYQYIQFTANTSSDIVDPDYKNGTCQMLVDVSNNNPIIQSFSLNFQANILGLDDRNTPLPLKLGWALGFRNGIYENNLKYVSEGVIDVLGPKYAFLVVDDYNNNVNNGFYSAFNSSILNNNILARITLNSGTTKSGVNSVIGEAILPLNMVTSTRQYFGPVTIQNLNIQLLDQYGRVIDLQNMDFSFCLSLVTSYDL